MKLQNQTRPEISADLFDAIRSFPLEREVMHCGTRIVVSPFDIYAPCPQCGSQIKVRSFSAAPEIEDVFDAVLEWLNQPQAQELARRRQDVLAEENE